MFANTRPCDISTFSFLYQCGGGYFKICKIGGKKLSTKLLLCCPLANNNQTSHRLKFTCPLPRISLSHSSPKEYSSSQCASSLFSKRRNCDAPSTRSTVRMSSGAKWLMGSTDCVATIIWLPR